MSDLYFPESTEICYPKDITWLEEKNWANEAVLIYFVTEDGACGYVQIVYSSMSVNVTTQVSAKYWSKDLNKFITKTGKGSALKLSDDKRSSSALNTSFTAEKDKLVYKIVSNTDDKLKYDLTFTSTCDYCYKTQKVLFDASNEKNGYCYHRFIPTGSVTGTVTVEGKLREIKGTGLYSHALQQNPQNCKKWNLITMNNGTDGIMMLEFVSKTQNVGKSGLVLNNKLVGVSTDCTVRQVSSVVDPDTKYEVPTEMEYTIKGKTIEGQKPYTAVLTMKPTCQIERLDCLSFLPYLVRKFVQTFISKPFIYQWLDQGEVKLTIDNETKVISGLVFQETSFVSK